jgi:hypothetical protein
MDTAIQNVLVDLKVIGMVEPNSKLYVSHGMLAVERSSFWMPFKRYWRSDNRQIVLQHIRQRVIELETLLTQRDITDAWVLSELASLMEPVKCGIRNLYRTYAGDSQLSANLDLLCSRLDHMAQTDLIFKKGEGASLRITSGTVSTDFS